MYKIRKWEPKEVINENIGTLEVQRENVWGRCGCGNYNLELSVRIAQWAEWESLKLYTHKRARAERVIDVSKSY